jgi:mono/diheme cytochrome c family protein
MALKVNKRRAVVLGVVLSGLAVVGALRPGGVALTNDAQAEADRAKPAADLNASASLVLDTYCVSCHGPEKQKGKVRFDALETIDTVDQQDLFVRAQDSLHFEEMPPAKAKQPSDDERAVLLAWLKEQLTGTASKKLEEKLRRPDAGNYVDHDALFSGKHADEPAYTYDRRWLISEYIFNEKFNRILEYTPRREIDGKRYNVAGDSHRRVSLTNPFLLPGYKGGVRYYANETLNGGHLLTMLTNVKEASNHMMGLAARSKSYLPAAHEIMALEESHKRTLAERERFLNSFIDVVLEDTFGDRHEAMLPEFVPVDVPAPIADNGGTKKAPFHAANPGREELTLIYHAMRKHGPTSKNDQEMIAKSEKDWFYYGDHPRKIEARITFLQNYMAEWRSEIEKHRYAERQRPPVYKERSASEMEAIQASLLKNRAKGDRFNDVIAKSMAQWQAQFEQERIDAGAAPREQVVALVEQLYVKIHERKPTSAETEKYASLTAEYMVNLGREDAIKKLMQTLLLSTEFVYRSEFGQGEADEHGRRMQSARDASYALAYALTDSSPDKELVKAANEGRLNTRADYEREVRRMLANRDQYYVIDESVDKKDLPNFTNMPVRELRFFREFFGYPKMLTIFKDNKRFGGNYDSVKTRVVAEADMIVEHILESDQDVFKKLLTTDEFYVYHSGDNDEMQLASDRIKKIYNYFKDKGWQDFELEDLRKHADFIGEMQMRGIDAKRLNEPSGRYNPLNAFMQQMKSFEVRLGKGQAAAAPYPSFPSHGFNNAWNRYRGRLQSPQVARMYNIDMTDWDYPTHQPVKIEKRKGILTHPAWLIAFAQNTETDPIHRGKWIQEKLLAGTIPDVPITVDAVVPEDPHKTLRQRMEIKTGEAYCWTCHQKMEPLGLPFEMYDDFGRHRTEERLEYPEQLVKKIKDKGAAEEDLRDLYKTLPLDTRGSLKGSGDSALDGDVTDALDLIDRLAKSDRVRQSIVRHAFRYFMGRNETLSDSKTLIDADRAYVESGGSFDELIVSLLTSDSFLYRKAPETKDLADAKP